MRKFLTFVWSIETTNAALVLGFVLFAVAWFSRAVEWGLLP